MYLFDIASQCPMLGGNAVFKARALYSLIDDAQVFDDPLICLQSGIVVRSATEPTELSLQVVPNPASEEATLVLGSEHEYAAQFIIMNALGKEVLRYAVPAEVTRFGFSTAMLSRAMYHYQVVGPGGLMGTGKFNVIC